MGGKGSPIAHLMRLVCKRWRDMQGKPARSPPPIIDPKKMIFTGSFTRSKDMPFSYTRKWMGKMDVYHHLMTPFRYLLKWCDGTKYWKSIRYINRDHSMYEGKRLTHGPYSWKWAYFICFQCMRKFMRKRRGRELKPPPKSKETLISTVNIYKWSPFRRSDSAKLVPVFPDIFEDKQHIARNPGEVVLLCDTCVDSMTPATVRNRVSVAMDDRPELALYEIACHYMALTDDD